MGRPISKPACAKTESHGSCGASLPADCAVILVKGVAPEPSAFTTQIFGVEKVLLASLPSSARWDEKNTCVPPGDHIGSRLSALMAVILVKGVAPEPSTFT